MSPAAKHAPYAVRMPSSPFPATIAVRVDTEPNEMPCTKGSCAPRYGTPSVCSTVATPLTNKAQEIRKAMSEPFNPAAVPMMMGTAMTPPNIDRMCCIPYPIVAGIGRRSSSGRRTGTSAVPATSDRVDMFAPSLH